MLANRIQNKIFFSTIQCAIEEHAGAFFIHKHSIFCMVNPQNQFSFTRLETGNRTTDKEVQLAKVELERISPVQQFVLSSSTDNTCIFSNGTDVVKLFLSKIEEILPNTEVTELAIRLNSNETYVFQEIATH